MLEQVYLLERAVIELGQNGWRLRVATLITQQVMHIKSVGLNLMVEF